MQRLTSVLCLVIVFWCGQAVAASETGQYALKGFGRHTCEQFIENRANGTQTYRQYGAWLAGYMSAINKLSDDTVDVAPWQTMDVIAAYVTNFCTHSPKSQIVDAIDAVVLTLWDSRVRGKTVLVEAVVHGKTSKIYQSVLVQVQTKLTKLGLYGGDLNGEFNSETELAIRKFQSNRKLPTSGLPDQRTLYRLFLQ